MAAINAALARAGRTPDSLTIAEIMEAFAVQAIACQEGAQIPREIVNPNGGALARGHPIGASGAILAVGLYFELVRKGGAGMAAIAAAGGLGERVGLVSALIVEAVKAGEHVQRIAFGAEQVHRRGLVLLSDGNPADDQLVLG